MVWDCLDMLCGKGLAAQGCRGEPSHSPSRSLPHMHRPRCLTQSLPTHALARTSPPSKRPFPRGSVF
eukprot:356152-Chlamydomonas_euryale.AAC.3